MPGASTSAASRRDRVVALGLAAGTAALLLAWLSAMLTRFELSQVPHPVTALVLLLLAGAVVSPFRSSLALIGAFPLFGNHPGGRFLEVLDTWTLAATLGFSWHLFRSPRPRPSGAVWRAGGLVLMSATLALAATLPAIWIWVVRIDDFPSLLTQTLTAAETVPLYSVECWLQLLLAAAWAYALAWAGADRTFVRNAVRVVAGSLLAVMVLGVLDFHHVIDLRHAVLHKIDPTIDYLDRFQSVFWNPSWFAWYFTIAFGLSLGWVSHLPSGPRAAGAAALLLSYGYFLANSQRGGFIAVHVIAITALVLARRPSDGSPKRRPPWILPVLIAAAGIVVYLTVGSSPRELQGLHRLISPQHDVNRRNLWATAILMWRSSPIVGIGEGAFGWQLRDFVPHGSRLDVGNWGDAHSTWLQVLATRGLVGFVAYSWLLIRLAQCVRRARASTRPSEDRGIGLGLVLAWIGFVTYSFVQHLFYLQMTQLFFWTLVALTWILRRDVPDPPVAARARAFIAVAFLLAAVLQVTTTRPLYAAASEVVAREPHGFYSADNKGHRRWSSRHGTLCLYPTGRLMTLEASTADRRSASDPTVVTLSSSGRVLDQFRLGRGGVTRTILLPTAPRRDAPEIPFGECRDDAAPFRLTVDVNRLWSPEAFGSADGRLLGVAIYKPSYSEPEDVGSPPVARPN